jgi:hypothetical protein
LHYPVWTPSWEYGIRVKIGVGIASKIHKILISQVRDFRP